MSRKWFCFAAPVVASTAAFLLISGCDRGQKGVESEAKRPTVSTASSTPAAPSKKAEEHGHKPGANGGIIVEIGRDNYHAEAVFEKGGLLKLFMLGKDEAKIVDVETQTLKAYVKDEAGAEAVEIDIQPVARVGDKPGRTSQFIGKLPPEFAGKPLTVTIPMIAIDGERFRIGFSSMSKHVSTKHDSTISMPAAATSDEEKELYLKPGGLYTQDDIKSNGNVTASQKFKGIVASHDLKPKAGEKICPITLTKANPKFTWIVGGKSYEFCCPPCVDEFVALAKSNPELIKGPDEFVKKR